MGVTAAQHFMNQATFQSTFPILIFTKIFGTGQKKKDWNRNTKAEKPRNRAKKRQKEVLYSPKIC